MPRPDLAGYAPNLNTLVRAAKHEHTALMEVFDTETNRRAVIVIAYAHDSEQQIQITPLALMFDGNPYERIAPPHPTIPGAYLTHDGRTITDADAEARENARWIDVVPHIGTVTHITSDHDTLNAIAKIIADEEFSADTYDQIADLLRANGRDLTPTHEYPDATTR